MTGAILSYQQEDSVKLLCEIDLKKLLPAPKQRERFNKKWKDFLDSDPCHKEIFERKNQLLNFDYESPFRIGRCVFISMPGDPSGPWTERGTLLNVRCHDSTL